MDGDQVFTDRGRPLYGATPCARATPLTTAEVGEAAAIIAAGRLEHRAAQLPERLRTRDWPSVLEVMLALDQRRGRAGAGWKIGAASEEIRRAEGVPGLSPGIIYRDTIFPSGTLLPPDLFINYRNCECEFAFQMSLDYPSRPAPYTEADARAGIDALLPALELGDTVFTDWYGASGYFGSSNTGTCTGHLFAAPGDTVRADFGPLGTVEAHFA